MLECTANEHKYRFLSVQVLLIIYSLDFKREFGYSDNLLILSNSSITTEFGVNSVN